MNKKTRNLISIRDITRKDLEEMLALGQRIMECPGEYKDVCRGKKLATLFFESSTRTRLSFEAAMIELGGNVLGFSSADSSSAAKGESVSDTVRTVSFYADIIAMRHPKEGAPKAACTRTEVPVINAGDGGHFHPTQTLTDLLTIKTEKGRLGSMVIGLCGDLCFGRTVHSLIEAMSEYPGNEFILISPEELRAPDYIRMILDKSGCSWREVRKMEEVMEDLDVLYMTRVQRERFFNEEDYARLKDTYILDAEKLIPAKPDLCIMHPLPRVNEISVVVDDDPRACYFRQALCGKYIRMALIMTLLGLEKEMRR
ncbi:MAG: aspartate carbamoyltransferase [Clostridiales bacterium]|nr:aspartate carbamoyltransferase [Clostridiales bacterium]